jgi:cytochrome P450
MSVESHLPLVPAKGARMHGDMLPVILPSFTGVQYFFQFLVDPVRTFRKAHAAHGSFVMMKVPRAGFKQKRMVVLAVGARFNREVLSNPAVWLTSGVNPLGPKNSAARRLRYGLVKIGGAEHQYYRRLLSQPLQRNNVEALDVDMARLVNDEISSWPQGTPIDLSARSNILLQKIAIGLLFGNDLENGLSVAEGIRRNVSYTRSAAVGACPLDVPGTPYHRMLRDAEMLEESILKWAACKRGRHDNRDLMSLLVNSPNENGQPVTTAQIVGHVPTLLGAAFETCHNALIWTIVMLDQHPEVARDLLDELQGRLAGSPPATHAIADLPLLDAVVKESMRILPPVPVQSRAASQDTTLAGYPIQKRGRVMLSPFLTNRNPDLYPQPDRFLPGRWNTIDPSPFEYSVFSSGPRMCPGYWFGLAALKTAVAQILLRFRPALVPGTKIDFKVRITMMPRRGIPIIMHRQDKAFASAPLRGAIRDLVQLPA